MAKYKGTEADLQEFGSDEEVGAPCPGTLIRVLKPEWQEAHRESCRRMVASVCKVRGWKLCTYREYMAGLVEKEAGVL